ncbi:MAG: malto-oligosyltrehalose synthase [Rhodovulum sulfidophilum]|uniref:Malto-oligosyltrehalose synthase n=1 Tax=Rhodovulum sulfidophilum TaxID=35806 RepID=A0A2W5PTJ1_RHOSU|nr:MAG: malto-oligosyltrehalose synthase [Rhodovulum sulfidophilum]
MSPPLRATYRVQLSPACGFRAAAGLAPYLAALGISHLYASPIFAARPGSAHGYDGIDPNRLNPELGTPEDFRAMVAALRAQGLGLIVDFVPNHMGIGGDSNKFWREVLEWGEASPFARWFDIDWASPVPGLAGKVLAPLLGAQYGVALAEGDLALRFDPAQGAFAIWAYDTHELPVRPEDYAGILERAELPGLAADCAAAAEAGPGAAWAAARAGLASAAARPETAAAITRTLAAFRDPGTLHALIERQRWRVSAHSFDREAINYRRFFLVNELAGLRVEDPEVFAATHALLIELIDAGLVDGVRIDHIDGLRDPKGYLDRLRGATRRPVPLHVEKILAFDERLPPDWDVEGTTGYEFANLVLGLLLNPAGEAALSEDYRAFTGHSEPPETVVRAAKIEIMADGMAPEIEGVARRLRALAGEDPRTCDLGLTGFRRAVVAVVAAFDAYRTYADADGISDADRARIERAVAQARAAEPALDPALFDLLARVMTLETPGEPAREIAFRLQQITGPVTAKGLEDTALYRFDRLIALNEVGSEPGRLGVSLAEFHAANAERAGREPRMLLATSTHDTKRGEDARTRIAAIAADPSFWRDRALDWRARLGPAAEEIDPNELYFFFQLLLGAWPVEWDGAPPEPAALDALRERVAAAMLKSVREAGRNTRWSFGDPGYEAALAALVDRALDPADPAGFLADFAAAAARFGEIGRGLSIVQTALKLTVPGVPDIYQGAEFWDQSLVDPDNRRPVDFAARAAALAEARPFDGARGGAADKLALVARLLDLRRRDPALFDEGGYEPVAIDAEGRVCGFVRRRAGAVLFVAAALGWTRATAERFAPARPPEALAAAPRWIDALTGAPADPGAISFRSGPVVVLVPGEAAP